MATYSSTTFKLVSPPPAEIPSSSSSQLSLPTGRLIELVEGPSSASTTLAVSILLKAQIDGETAAWVEVAPGTLYPNDLADSGVDLASLIVVHVPKSAGAFALLKSADWLLRSGGFGLVVVDLRQTPISNDATVWQGRLLALAREHRSQLVLLTNAHNASGSLVSLRLISARQRLRSGIFAVESHALKDKTGFFKESLRFVRRGPWGCF